MYRLDWLEQLKLRTTRLPGPGEVDRVSPAVWSLGFTSMLTDISAEMVNSALPAFLVLHLRMSPFEFGLVDGVYNGFAMALLGLVAGSLADRSTRHKGIAAAGYGLSAACKLLLLAAGSAFGWIIAVIGLDRLGKAIRTSPRDTMISLNTPPALLATAFAVHRALDAGGMLLGPLLAFFLLWQLPAAYDVVWLASFLLAVLGFAVLMLFVPNPRHAGQLPTAPTPGHRPAVWRLPRLRVLSLAGLLLALGTMSDGFIFLILQQRTGVPAGYFPLFYVAAAAAYMLLSVPAGRFADRAGRRRVFMAGYLAMGGVYALLLAGLEGGLGLAAACIFLLGLYYACTEGILMAMASQVVPPGARATGLALAATALATGKLGSSVLFGWLWHTEGQPVALVTFACLLAAAVLATFALLRDPRPSAASP